MSAALRNALILITLLVISNASNARRIFFQWQGIAHDKIRFKALLFILVMLHIPSPAWSNEISQGGQDYTASVKAVAAKAEDAVKAAAAGLAAAGADLLAAKAALTLAGGTAVGTTAETLAALASAEAAVAAATATLATATTVAATATVAVAGWALGTSVSQGIWGLLSYCWDPICTASISVPTQQRIYEPTTLQQALALIPSLSQLATGITLTQADFVATGVAGQATQDFLTAGIRLFGDAALGAAAATAGRPFEVLQAARDLQAELVAYRNTMQTYGELLPTLNLASPLTALQAAFAQFDTAAVNTNAACSASGSAACTAIASFLAEARNGFISALGIIASTPFYLNLVEGPNPLFVPLTLQDFLAFISDTQRLGAAALPQSEIDTVEALLSAFGVTFPGLNSFSDALASVDATANIAGQLSLFDASGMLTNADLLVGSATTQINKW